MKEIKKLKSLDEKAMFDKINELVDAFNKLNKTTRKIVFEDKQEKQREKDRAMAEALVGVYTQGWDKYK